MNELLHEEGGRLLARKVVFDVGHCHILLKLDSKDSVHRYFSTRDSIMPVCFMYTEYLDSFKSSSFVLHPGFKFFLKHCTVHFF